MYALWMLWCIIGRRITYFQLIAYLSKYIFCIQNVNLSLKISYNHACGKDKGGCDSEKDCKDGLKCATVYFPNF